MRGTAAALCPFPAKRARLTDIPHLAHAAIRVTNDDRRRYVGWSDTTKGDRNMKKLIAALALTAAVATPALAGGFRQEGALTPSPGFAYDETAQGKPYRAPTNMMSASAGYDAYAYAPDAAGSVPAGAMAPPVWHNGQYVGADPDPGVRTQLGIDSDTILNR
jgi:hypothetical protein